MRKRGAYVLHQMAEKVMGQLDHLAAIAETEELPASKVLREAADKLGHALDLLQKEVDRKRLLKEKYQRDLRGGT
jgi:predicted Zn-dependent protease